jgi:selenocysteine lyase/cysteine desulfurase
MDVVAAHEAELTAYTLRRLAEVPGLRVYGDPDPARSGYAAWSFILSLSATRNLMSLIIY